ncbi:Hypothetical protein D9617_80g101430 [Elsinoe fawcettii]|nr:Hypothetical protein D9617_80g101430 [Elsinoe fawcettii]
MTKRDFFKCFYPAWQQAFTVKNVASAWCKSGPWPFDPDMVLSKLMPRNQREITPRQHSRGPSSSPPLPWDTPSSKKKLKAYVNKTVDRTAKKIIRRLSSDLHKSRAETVLERIDKGKAIEALGHEKKKRERGKKWIEDFRAEEGSSAILFSPGKIGSNLELQDRREQYKEQEREQKEQRVQERAAAELLKEQEAQTKREEKVTAQAIGKEQLALQKASKAAEKEAKRVQKQLEQQAKAKHKKPVGRPKKQLLLQKPMKGMKSAGVQKSHSRILAKRIRGMEEEEEEEEEEEKEEEEEEEEEE